MRQLLLVPGLALLFLQAPSGAQSESSRTVTDQRLASLGAHDVPGVAYAVVEQGEVTEIGATGVKRLGSDEPITPDTPFLIGSVSKSFTALAVMQLVEAGELSLDDPIARYLPGFADEASGAITIRQLLSHTSGFSTLQGHFPAMNPSVEMGPIAQRAAALATMDRAHGPGEVWEYSNANYVVLGRLIEVVSGQPFPVYVEEHVLEPIGMIHSFVSDGEVHPVMATGHTPWFGTKRPLDQNKTDLGTAPQGGIVSSASDMARYMEMLMNGESDIVSARSKKAMMEPASDTSPYYGFGWTLNPQGGTVWHTGASPGFTTLVTMMPKTKKGVVVLINATSGIGFGDADPLLNGIASSAMGFADDGPSSRWPQKATFLLLAVLPLAFLASIAWAWFHRDGLRAKSGRFGLFSLWFPLLTTVGIACFFFLVVPRLSGLPMATMRVYLPDLALTMTAASITGVLWALVRLGLAYTGRPARS